MLLIVCLLLFIVTICLCGVLVVWFVCGCFVGLIVGLFVVVVLCLLCSRTACVVVLVDLLFCLIVIMVGLLFRLWGFAFADTFW